MQTHAEYWDSWPTGTDGGQALPVIKRHIVKNWDILQTPKKAVYWVLTGKLAFEELPSELFQDLIIWHMPYYHTKSWDDLNAYYDWLWAGGRNAICGSRWCQEKTDPLYKVCGDIVRERKRRRV